LTDRNGRASWAPPGSAESTWAEILAVSPTILHVWPSIEFPLGAASAVGPLLRERYVHFLVMPTSSLEPPGESSALALKARSYLADHPKHRVTFLCNTPLETELMLAEHHMATTLNQNCLVDDAVFRPLPDVEPIHDAVYNARLSPIKRHELAAGIEKLALVYYYCDEDGPPPVFHQRHARYAAMLPTAHFVNPLTPDGCQWMPKPEVNRVLAQSKVGLCLSAREGAMLASIEYLLAGLPVVSTPSIGGRDHYFDDEFCLVVPADPRSIRDAVQALVARNLPREQVRARTLARVEADRRRYIALVQEIIDRAGGREQFAERFWSCTRGKTIFRWRSMTELSATLGEALSRQETSAQPSTEPSGPHRDSAPAAPVPIPVQNRSQMAPDMPAHQAAPPTPPTSAALERARRVLRYPLVGACWQLALAVPGLRPWLETAKHRLLRSP
jgi:glycosyltransferase involved in cell wall biosynthesis